MSNVGASSGGSYGSYGSSGGLSLRRRSYGSFGSSGGTSYGSSGGYNYVTTATSPITTSFVQNPVETSYSVPAPMGSSFLLEQNYPVGDYGLMPGYPTSQTLPGSNTIGGVPMESAIGGAGVVAPTVAQPGYYDPTQGQEATPTTDEGGADPEPGVSEGDSTSIQRSTNSAVLSVNVPEEAKVFINNQLTSTPGARRSYEGTDLNPEMEYHYHVKAVIERDGKQWVRSKQVVLKPGFDQEIDLNFDQPPVTTLALKVPEESKVTLCGNQTRLTGVKRKFVTTELVDGDVCQDYKVEVAFQKDGEWVKASKVIDLAAGDFQTIDFTSDVIASRTASADEFASRQP